MDVSPAPVTSRVLHRHRDSYPKPAHFPTASPLTSEELALLRLAKSDPKYIPKGLTQLDRPMQPIEIKPIEISPLKEAE